MKVVAPGKLVLTGAYAVLEGAPAVVVAVDRHAIADSTRVDDARLSAETRAALGDVPSPLVDASALHDGATKLGLGSSAAVLVASLGARAAERGEDLRSSVVREHLFDEARAAHARVQSGGSGVDVAASVYGGVLRYQLHGDRGVVRPTSLPNGLVVSCFWSGASVRTSELRARVDALRARDGAAHAARFAALHAASVGAAEACDAHHLRAFLVAARAFAKALAALGAAADAPIVPPAFATLAARAQDDDAVFFPSGAGGGDVAVHLSDAGPSAAFAEHARSAGMRPITFAIDHDGVRVAEPNDHVSARSAHAT